MNYNSFAYDTDLIEENIIEENLLDQLPERKTDDLVAIHFSRRGLAYKNIYKEDYQFVFYGKTAPVLKELKAPSYFPESKEFAFFRKGIRDGYLYIYCPSDNFWLVYEVKECKDYILLTGDGSDAAREAIEFIKSKRKGRKTESCIYLPEKDEYFVAYSSFVWTKDYLDKAVKNVNSGDSPFVSIDVKRWAEAKKNKNPLVLPNAYIFEEDIYELRDKSGSNPYKHIVSQEGNMYTIGDYAARASKYSDDQTVLYFTLDDTLGVVEDLNAEMKRYISYQNEFSQAVQRCKPMSHSSKSNAGGESKEFEALYSSTATLYNMLYANGGALNMPEHKSDKSTDGGHKYQSLVQKYKFTKLLAVEERKAIQKKYIVLRDLLGKLMECKAYKKEVNTFLGQSSSIAFMGQSILMSHLWVLLNKPDSFDAEISLNDEDPTKDKWAGKVKEIVMAYLKLPNAGEDASSPLVKLLRKPVDMEDVDTERKNKPYYLPETELQADFNIESATDLLLGCIKIATTGYTGLAEHSNNIKNLEKSINKLVGINDNIVQNRKAKIAEILAKYGIGHDSEFVDELYRENEMNIKDRAKTNNATAQKVQSEIKESKVHQRYRLKQNKAEIGKLEADLLEVNSKGRIPAWIKKGNWDGFVKGLEQIIDPINLCFTAMKIMEDAKDENNKVTISDCLYYSLLILGSSFDMAKKGYQILTFSDEVAKVAKLTKGMKLAKGLMKGIAIDVVLFAAECVNSYRMLSMRNSKAAYYNTLSAGLLLMSGVCATVALCLPMIGLIILLVVAAALMVASYYSEQRADKMKHDVWQSFLICSIFSNYYEETFWGRRIDTNIEETSDTEYYKVAEDLYEYRSEIAINNYYYKNKEYNLQDFTEMLCLLDEMSTCFEINISLKKVDYSYEATGNYIIPTNLSVAISYFGTTRFNAVDYFFYIETFPIGNSAKVTPLASCGINPLRKDEIQTEEGKQTLTLTFDIWKALHEIKNTICNDERRVAELVSKNVLTLAEPRSESHIIYPTTMTFTFGCRLVNEGQEKSSNQSGNDQKRIYLPWKDGEQEVYKGFKCRVGIPVPKNIKDFSAFYYRNIYGHLLSSVGTLDELSALQLREIPYTTKDEK